MYSTGKSSNSSTVGRETIHRRPRIRPVVGKAVFAMTITRGSVVTLEVYQSRTHVHSVARWFYTISSFEFD